MLIVSAAPTANAQLAPSGTVTDIGHGVGFDVHDGVPWAVGSNYKAAFDEHGVTFVPALGRDAPRTFPLRFELMDFGRDGGVSRRVVGADPTLDDHTMVYARTGVVERYDVRPEGVKQSFVFDTLPPGDGDLVVRGRIDTDLPVRRAENALEFVVDGVGGVSVGEVLGIDARGRRAVGTMSFAEAGGEQTLELRLPADFVANAALPLVLDPMIGSVTEIASQGRYRDLDIAYDATHDVYLVVWQRWLANNDADILSRRVDAQGNAVGSIIHVRNSNEASVNPHVANVNLADTFVVAWSENDDVWVDGIHAGSGNRSGPILVASGSDTQGGTAVGGEATLVDNDALVVWTNFTRRRIDAAQVAVGATGVLTVFGTTTIASRASPEAVHSPAISRTGGVSGRHLITWNLDIGVPDIAIHSALVDRNLNVLDRKTLAILTTGLPNKAVVDGDGTGWVVAYNRDEAGTILIHQVVCRGVTYDPTSQSLSFSSNEFSWGQLGVAEFPGAVAWLGPSAVVAYGNRTDNFLRSVDAFACTTCEGTVPVAVGGGNSSTRVTRGAPGEALVAWASGTYGTTSLLVQPYVAQNGIVVDLGGGCGGGAATHSCAVPGNAGYTMRLQGAPPLANTNLIVSPTRIDIGCGPCTVVPDPYTGFVFNSGSTTTEGGAVVSMPLPPDPTMTGLTFYQQWFVASPSGACQGLAVSNALEVTIQ